MDSYEYSELLKVAKKKVCNVALIIKPEELQKRLKEIEACELDPDLWKDSKRASKLGKEKSSISSILKKYNSAKMALEEACELYEMAVDENDNETLTHLFSESDELLEQIQELEVSMMLSGEDDSKNAIISIHPGSGGTESSDWASMLYRMYVRFCEREGFGVELLDFQEGDEAGIKDVSFMVKGENAYGYLKAENGVHRLVRVSPFDSAGRRHTSFTSVLVSPEVDDDINIEIEDKDIRIDYYRASGAGGQHVNKTESAVRITHYETGIVVQCQNDRSQHKNKDTAMKMLKSRLYEFELHKQKKAGDQIEKSDNSWGHQIRSYVLFPYQQVKDHRTNKSYGNTDAVLDGDIKKIIEDVLIANNSK